MKNSIQEFKEAVTRRFSAVAAVTSAAVVDLGDIFGIACDTYAAGAVGTYTVLGRFSLDKEASLVVTAGQSIYWDETNSEATTAREGRFIGIAAAASAASATTVEVDLNKSVVEGPISLCGSDGRFKATYQTIDLAVAAADTDDMIKLKAGSYTLTAGVDITSAGLHIMGVEPGVTIVGAADADYCFKTVLGAITATKTVYFSNFLLDHGDDATQIGIQIANVSAGARVNVEIENVSGESDGGNSIQVDHSVTAHSVRLYVTGGTFEGPVSYTVGNTDDRVRFEGSTLRGGLVTSASATAMEILLQDCKVLHEGVTGGNAAQLLYALYCLSETDANPNVYAALDTNDLAGSHTESVLFPAS